jgi:hypothetical protein
MDPEQKEKEARAHRPTESWAQFIENRPNFRALSISDFFMRWEMYDQVPDRRFPDRPGVPVPRDVGESNAYRAYTLGYMEPEEAQMFRAIANLRFDAVFFTTIAPLIRELCAELDRHHGIITNLENRIEEVSDRVREPEQTPSV